MFDPHMTVSILVPVYGVEQYIEQCAVSLFEQTYKEIEYISTKEVVEDLLLSLLSWLMVLWLIISVILDIYMGWPSKGYDLNIKKNWKK